MLFHLFPDPPPNCPDCTLIYSHDPDNGFLNPDSVMIDFTDGNKLYAKGEFNIIFNDLPFPLPDSTSDSLLTYHASDIDTSFSETFNTFDSLKTTFGSMTFSKTKESYYLYSSTSLMYYSFKLNFDDLGNSIAQLKKGKVEEGWHQISFNGNGLKQGVYLVTLKYRGKLITKKLIKQ